MFSEAVDTIIERSKRSDKLEDITGYLNSSVKESQLLQFFHNDLVEDTITVTGSPYSWTKPREVRLLRTVRYDGGEYPDYKPPGRSQIDMVNYYYASVGTINFAGEFTDEIDLAYYRYLPRLRYYTAALRPAVWDDETETWTYLAAYDTDADTRETARNLVTNWLLDNWTEMLIEGALAKLYKSLADQRTVTSYSVYKTQQTLMSAQETYETMGK